MIPKFYRKVLKNGMTVVFEKRDIPVVSVAFAVRQGGINEQRGEKGISHFIEHMLYKGTPTRNSKQIAEEIEKRGGVLNGFTSEVLTAYWCKMPSKHLDVALDVLGDMVRNPKFEEKELNKERKVIFEEIKLYKDSPGHYIGEGIHKMLYEEPFGIPLIGTPESMNNITKEIMLKKFEEVYQPNNLILCVVGNGEFKDITDFVEKNFPKGNGKIKKLKVKTKNQTKIEKRKGIDQANLMFAYHIPTAKNEKSHAAFLLNVVMAGGMSSRLFSEIREKRNLAYSIGGESEIHNDHANNYIHAGTSKENVEKVKTLILEEFEKVSKELGEKEFLQVKDQIIGNHQLSMENSQTQMVGLLLNEINGNAKDFYGFEKKIKAVKLRDVKNLAKKVGKNYSFFALIPE
jgi:predicted Zn-dependent peptidase